MGSDYLWSTVRGLSGSVNLIPWTSFCEPRSVNLVPWTWFNEPVRIPCFVVNNLCAKFQRNDVGFFENLSTRSFAHNFFGWFFVYLFVEWTIHDGLNLTVWCIGLIAIVRSIVFQCICQWYISSCPLCACIALLWYLLSRFHVHITEGTLCTLWHGGAWVTTRHHLQN